MNGVHSNSTPEPPSSCTCNCHNTAPYHLAELLPSILHFLETDLAGEDLSPSFRPRYRDLLDRIRLQKISHCSTPSQAVSARRRMSLQPSTAPPVPNHVNNNNNNYSALVSAVVRRNKDLNSANSSHRLSLPSQAFSNFQPPLPAKSDTSAMIDYETPNLSNGTLLLPSKQANRSASRRMSAFIEQPWSISGPLFYRASPSRWLNPREANWQRFPHCALHGCRLLAHKSRGGSPSLQLNLAGYTSLYVEREGSVNHVIKLTHPSLPTHVLAADTEEQARAWVQHLDGQTPMPPPKRNFSEAADFGAFYNLPPGDGEPDSGFSGPHSSSSNSNESCEPQNPACDCRDSPTRVPARSASLSPQHSQNQPEYSHSRSLNSSKSDSFMRRISTGFRDSIGSGRRKRNCSKHLFQNMIPAKDAIISGLVLLKIPAVTQHWYRRWVQLRPNAQLEVFGLDSDGSGKLERQIVVGHLKLCSLQVDKKHSSAMRFYTEDGTDIVYMEVVDKLEMAKWIKALIQVMNLTPSYEPVMELIDLNQAQEQEMNRRSLLLSDDEESPVHRRPLPPVPGSTTDLASEEHPYHLFDNTFTPPPGQSLACLATEETFSGSDGSANSSPANTLTKTNSLRALLMRRPSLERIDGELVRLQQEVHRLRRQRSELRREEASVDQLQDVSEEIDKNERRIESLRASTSDPLEEANS